jgi:hypothetical protein
VAFYPLVDEKQSLIEYVKDSIPGVFDSAEKTVFNALLPIDQVDAVAIFISEGASGFLGGVVLKLISIIDGNKNKDAGIIAAGTSGAYFGVAGAVRALGQIAGLSPLFMNLIALVLASAVR